MSLSSEARAPTLIARKLETNRSTVRTRPSLRSSPRALGRYMTMMETWFPKKPTRKCPECMQVVDMKAVRCHHCCIPLDPSPPSPKPKPKRSTVTAARDMLTRAHKASSGCCASSACRYCCGGGGSNAHAGEGGNRGNGEANGNEQQGDSNT